jgi:hypothetical protein
MRRVFYHCATIADQKTSNELYFFVRIREGCRKIEGQRPHPGQGGRHGLPQLGEAVQRRGIPDLDSLQVSISSAFFGDKQRSFCADNFDDFNRTAILDTYAEKQLS